MACRTDGGGNRSSRTLWWVDKMAAADGEV